MRTCFSPVTAWAWAACLLVSMYLAPTSGELTAYRVNWCHCDLDPCLESVLTALLNSTSMPSCSPEPPTQVSKPGNTNSSTPSSAGAGQAGGSQGTGEEATTEPPAATNVTEAITDNPTTTTDAYGGGEGAEADNTTTTDTPTTTNTPTTTDTPTTTIEASNESESTDTTTTTTATTTEDSSTTTTDTTPAPSTTPPTTTTTTVEDSTTATAAGTTTTDGGDTTDGTTTTTTITTTTPTEADDSTTTENSTTTTFGPGRRRRDVGQPDTSTDNLHLTQLLKEEDEEEVKEEEEGRHPEDPLSNEDSALKSRRKRNVESDVTSDVVVAKPFRMVTKTVDDLGVMFSASHNASTCSCVPGSLVSASLCIKNLRYHQSFASNGTANSANYTYYSHLFLAELHKFMSALKTQDGIAAFRRLDMPKFTNRSDGSTLLSTVVHLAALYPEPTYYVASSLETPTRLTRRIAGYKTDTEMCLTVKNVTPKKAEDNTREFFWYLLLLVALGVLVVLAVLLCVGKSQAFYVRFW